ncbi:hypothetical protein [Lacipirellula parvula]|uniref:Uncharacterized protein n=1 Tax=Lacipirellula parvula TaxID=2650471 RepID=A0A5K7X232_9BACT|nr:hypothetical protein [Lacipirellula parvula]BBO30530.1 hypothetical protein PLANPX_0142 [Lacipirellula parvula]
MNSSKHFLITQRVLWAAVAASCFASSPSISHGELTMVQDADGQQGLTVFKMTVTPAAEPVPALKHRLTLRERELKPGNAATHYSRAFPEGGVESIWKRLEKEYGDEEVHRWYDQTLPLEKLPLDKAKQAATSFQDIIDNFVAPGSERLDCDWGHGIITELRGPDIYGFRLPEIQAMRAISRGLMLAARVAVADHDYPQVINLLRMNYRLGEDVAKSPFIVSGLVGLAICGMGNAEAIELISAPDSPNLYWAIAELPRPLVDLRTSIRHELSFNVAIFPFMESPETAQHSPEQWAQLLADSFISLQQLSANGSAQPDPQAARLAVAGWGVLAYPAAKQRLLDSGMEAAVVEAMPVGQVLAIDAAREFRRIADVMEKWWYVPVAQLKGVAIDSEEFRGGSSLEGNFAKAAAQVMLPALRSVRSAEVKLEWQLNALQTIEAIRMHAAQTGKLPAALDEIKAVPLPLNPLTGKPYQYRLDGDTAILELPSSDGISGSAWRFEIKLAKP